MQSEFKSQDARLLLVSFTLTAFFLWSLPLVSLFILAIVYSFLYFYTANKKNRESFFYKNLCLFCFLWALCIFIIQSFDFYNFKFYINFKLEHFLFALHFALRLFVLGLLGLNLFIMASPKEYALALVYFASFISTKHAWKVGLISLLILKYFYEFYELCTKMIKIASYRIKKHLSIKQRLYYFSQNLLRILVDKNYALSVALFARGFNNKKSFDKEWGHLLDSENIKNHALILLLNLIPCLLYVFMLLNK